MMRNIKLLSVLLLCMAVVFTSCGTWNNTAKGTAIGVELGEQQINKKKIELPSESFECFDPSTNTMRVAPGEYELFYGTSSAARDLQSVKVTLRDRKEQK